jgi:hypothetical protein
MRLLEAQQFGQWIRLGQFKTKEEINRQLQALWKEGATRDWLFRVVTYVNGGPNPTAIQYHRRREIVPKKQSESLDSLLERIRNRT